LRKTICYVATSAGDWGGASRVLNVTLRLLDRSRFEPLVLFPAPGPILHDLDRRGIRYRIWGPLTEYTDPVSYVRALARAWRFLRREHVAVLHVNHAGFWRAAELLAAKIARVPILAHYHVAIDQPPPFTSLLDRVLTVSEFVSRASNSRHVDKTVIYNAVELERFDQARNIRAELGVPSDATVVSFVGQIRGIKGVDLFIRLADAIQDPTVRFLIAGECRESKGYPDGYSRAQLMAEITHDARIVYVGYRQDVENIYRSSDILVMPSRWQEPFGLINIEAGAARRPMVAARVGGIPEVIRDGVNGLLFESDDFPALVSAVRRLIEDQRLRVDMGERARHTVESEFTVAPIRKLEALYDEVS